VPPAPTHFERTRRSGRRGGPDGRVPRAAIRTQTAAAAIGRADPPALAARAPRRQAVPRRPPAALGRVIAPAEGPQSLAVCQGGRVRPRLAVVVPPQPELDHSARSRSRQGHRYFRGAGTPGDDSRVHVARLDEQSAGAGVLDEVGARLLTAPEQPRLERHPDGPSLAGRQLEVGGAAGRSRASRLTHRQSPGLLPAGRKIGLLATGQSAEQEQPQRRTETLAVAGASRSWRSQHGWSSQQSSCPQCASAGTPAMDARLAVASPPDAVLAADPEAHDHSS
jgi:hypothetical protein